MDWRLLGSALAIDGGGIVVFQEVQGFAFHQSSLTMIGSTADDAILIFAGLLSAGLLFLVGGLAWRGSPRRSHLAWLTAGSLVLGIWAWFAAFGANLAYGDDLMACGRIPWPQWTSNPTIDRCGIFWSVSYASWAGPLFGVVVLTSALVFVSCVWMVHKLSTPSVMQPNRSP